MDFKTLFYYDPKSPTGLRFLVGNKANGNKKRNPNDPVGTRRKLFRDGALRKVAVHIRINGKYYFVHRIVWELFNGPIPKDMVIDHLDGNPWNNVIENLACKTRLQNSQNLKKNIRNKSGAVGIQDIIYNDKVTFVQASLQYNKKRYYKCFSVKDFGYDLAFDMAKKWRSDLIDKLNMDGAMITERHTKDDY